MIYTDDVKKELDAILKAFENYIDGQDYFDIVYSKKIGYVWIVADEPGAAGAEQLDTPETMLDRLLFDKLAPPDKLCPGALVVSETLRVLSSADRKTRRASGKEGRGNPGGASRAFANFPGFSSNVPRFPIAFLSICKNYNVCVRRIAIIYCKKVLIC